MIEAKTEKRGTMVLNKKRVFDQTEMMSLEPLQFKFSNSDYIVTIAEGEGEVREALRLRYDVFRAETRKDGSYSESEELETDKYDTQCYHLIVRYRKSGRVVGTYRLQNWEMAQSGIGFYAANQFELSGIPDPFLRQSIEIGRGCIHKDHRNGRVLYMLWKGLAASLIGMRKTTLFGCCSLFSRSQDEGLFLMNSLEEKKYVAKGLVISAKRGYECVPGNNFDRPASLPEIPMLFQKYLDFGAKVCSEPAIDRDFGSIDYLVMLHFHQMDRKVYHFFTRDLQLPQTG